MRTRELALEDFGSAPRLASRELVPTHLSAAIEVVLDEMDSVSQRARREGGPLGLPALTIELANGQKLHGVILEYAAWQRTVALRTASGEVVRVSLGNIVAVAMSLGVGYEEHEETPIGANASGCVRVYR